MDFKKGFALLDTLIGLSILIPVIAVMISTLIDVENALKTAMIQFSTKAPVTLHENKNKAPILNPKIETININRNQVLYRINE